MARRALDLANVQQHYEKAVLQLVEAHGRLTDPALVLAIRYDSGRSLDIDLLEVLEGFPGGEDDPLFETQFGPNERFVILGNMNLVLVNPAQLLRAVQVTESRSRVRGAAAIRTLIQTIRSQGQVVFEARRPKRRFALAHTLRAKVGL